MSDEDSNGVSGHDIVDQAPVGITRFDVSRDGSPVVYANDRFLELTGHAASEVVGRNWLALTGAETSEASVGALRDAVAANEQVTVDLRNYRADGTLFWNRIKVAPVCDGSEETTQFVAFHEDVTEEKHHEETLEALHAVATRLQTAETVDAVCERTVAAASTLLDYDMCTVLVRNGDWLVPRATAEDAPPDGSRRMRVDQGLAGKTHQTGEAQIVNDLARDEDSDPAKEIYRSGISVPVGDRGVFQAVQTETDAFDDRDLELTELLVTHTAATIGRIEREKALHRQNERLEAFAEVVSHDLRNPLTVLGGSLQMAEATGDSEHFERGRRALERMEQLIDDLLSLARTGDVEEATAVHLPTVATESWDAVATVDATLDVETTATVLSHGGRLRQLLENLFRNSVEHASDGVTVTVGDIPDGTGFSVEDDGPGIPAEDRERVFESGFSTTGAGTGLGLSIVGEIAEAHGWDVSLTESASGGARFEIRGVETAS
ncbi:ATP-binding protein [Halosimplex amylolyticum]|uniref:receiver/sensor box histidine kinase n=1 Tax=Halosimplex amylolyticum TaxID=3396616 RepID=UPI003F543147